MLQFALNHMTVPTHSMKEVAALARALNMDGVELRNDLSKAMFDGQPATSASGIGVIALAEVKAFNAYTPQTRWAALGLMDLAVASGAKAIALIPQVGGAKVSPGGLREAMVDLGPELKARGLLGLIEPIGFASSSLRDKAEVVTLIDSLDMADQFGLIHDTFHHFLSDETSFYPQYTKIVHISGVTDPRITPNEMTDAHRGLVDERDRLGNTEQIQELMRGGFNGPFSFEAFSPDVHATDDPKAALSRSIRFIEDAVVTHTA